MIEGLYCIVHETVSLIMENCYVHARIISLAVQIHVLCTSVETFSAINFIQWNLHLPINIHHIALRPNVRLARITNCSKMSTQHTKRTIFVINLIKFHQKGIFQCTYIPAWCRRIDDLCKCIGKSINSISHRWIIYDITHSHRRQRLNGYIGRLATIYICSRDAQHAKRDLLLQLRQRTFEAHKKMKSRTGCGGGVDKYAQHKSTIINKSHCI